jgi:predicted CXXCH cytochrome family protein
VKTRSAAISVILAVALWGAAPAADSQCSECHGDQGTPIHKSIHAAVGCAGCHASIKGFPHPEKIAKVECGSCHSGPASAMTASVHSNTGKQLCATCHGDVHAIVPVKDHQSPVYPLNMPRTCGACHGDKKFAKDHGLPEVYSQYMDSIHGFALTKDGLLVAATCSSCHGSHEILEPKNPKSRTNRVNIPDTCGSCHQGIQHDYAEGSHGKAMAAKNAKAPVCTNCHSAHQISNVRTESFQMKTTATCGGCHQEKFGTYRDTFHAQVSALGFVETAHCWNCHGEHQVFAKSDPKSPVAKANLVQTCGKCHEGANASFVTYSPHADARNAQTYPALHYSRLFMNLLLSSVLGFFALHTALWYNRSRVERRDEAKHAEEAREREDKS